MTAELAYLSRFLKQRSGLDLSAGRQYSLDSQLLPVARRHGLAGVSALVAAMKQPGGTALGDEVVEAMTTNESFFFRDKTPFDQFRDAIIPELLNARSTLRKLRIWCAAASTGQEPYSLGMELREMQSRMANWSTDIIGTDLSPRVLEKARTGLYSQFEVQRGLPVRMLVKYFEQKGEMWQLSPQIRAMVDFKVHNLLENLSNLGKFDVIFCRNVLIYFEAATKSNVLARICQQLAPDGFLVLGESETMIGLTDDFALVPGSRGLYRPRGNASGEVPRMAAAGGGGAISAVSSQTANPAGLVQAGQNTKGHPALETTPSPAVHAARGTGGVIRKIRGNAG